MKCHDKICPRCYMSVIRDGKDGLPKVKYICGSVDCGR